MQQYFDTICDFIGKCGCGCGEGLFVGFVNDYFPLPPPERISLKQQKLRNYPAEDAEAGSDGGDDVVNQEESSETQAAWTSAAGREEVLMLVEQQMVLVDLNDGSSVGATEPSRGSLIETSEASMLSTHGATGAMRLAVVTADGNQSVPQSSEVRDDILLVIPESVSTIEPRGCCTGVCGSGSM